MRLRNITLTALVLAATIIVPATANASISSEISSANKVERWATHDYPHYRFVANCDQETRNYYWCDVIGQNGDCFIQGNASVRRHVRGRYYVKLIAMQRDCY